MLSYVERIPLPLRHLLGELGFAHPPDAYYHRHDELGWKVQIRFAYQVAGGGKVCNVITVNPIGKQVGVQVEGDSMVESLKSVLRQGEFPVDKLLRVKRLTALID